MNSSSPSSSVSAGAASSGRLVGRRALITGSTSGIGRAIAERLAAEGAVVVISGRNADEGSKVVAAIRADGLRAEFVQADLAQGQAAVTGLVADAVTRAGGSIDILVNNAATLIPAQSLLEVTQDQIDGAFAVNVRAPFLLTAAVVPAMAAAGRGAIINVGSVNGLIGMAVAALYGSTKAALHSLTASWAAELAPQGIRVNAIAPGPTTTPANAPIHAFLQELSQGVPDRRAATADEVAGVVAFLASDEAGHIHGVTLPIDGGMLAAR
jgi:NAD(P)-dependent dehydrogenase (short-subunit alcohol dehydrogenase family)